MLKITLSYIHFPLPKTVDFLKATENDEIISYDMPPGTLNILEIKYPPIMNEEHAIQYADHFTVIYSILVGDQDQNVKLVFSEEDQEINLEKHGNLDYIGHIKSIESNKVIFIGQMNV